MILRFAFCCQLIISVSISCFSQQTLIKTYYERNHAGRQLFAQYCASCHTLSWKLVGPALDKVTQERSRTWLVNFIRNAEQLRKEGDSLSILLYKASSSMTHPAFDSWSDNEINDLLNYLDDCGSNKSKCFDSTHIRQEYFVNERGNRDGDYREYYYNSQLYEEKEFKDGQLWNVLQLFDENGSKEDICCLKNGEGEIKNYVNGKLVSVQKYSDGKLNGKSRYLLNNGTWIEHEYKDDVFIK